MHPPLTSFSFTSTPHQYHGLCSNFDSPPGSGAGCPDSPCRTRSPNTEVWSNLVANCHTNLIKIAWLRTGANLANQQNGADASLASLGIRCRVAGKAGFCLAEVRRCSVDCVLPDVQPRMPAGLLEPSRTRSSWTICGRRPNGPQMGQMRKTRPIATEGQGRGFLVAVPPGKSSCAQTTPSESSCDSEGRALTSFPTVCAGFRDEIGPPKCWSAWTSASIGQWQGLTLLCKSRW